MQREGAWLDGLLPRRNLMLIGSKNCCEAFRTGIDRKTLVHLPVAGIRRMALATQPRELGTIWTKTLPGFEMSIPVGGKIGGNCRHR